MEEPVEVGPYKCGNTDDPGEAAFVCTEHGCEALAFICYRKGCSCMKPHLHHHHVAIEAVLSNARKPYQVSEEMLKQEKSVDELLDAFIKKLQELGKRNK